MQHGHELVEAVEHGVCHRLQGDLEALLHDLEPLGEVVGVLGRAGDGFAVLQQAFRQISDGESAVSDRCGHCGSGLGAEDLRRDACGLCGRACVLDLLVVHSQPIARADAFLRQCADALFHGAEDFLSVDAGLVELAHEGARCLEGIAHLLKLWAELLHIAHKVSEAHAGALADLEDVVHRAAHVVGVDVPLLEGLARLLDHAAEVVPQHIAHLERLLGDLLKLRAGQAEPGVIVRDGFAGVLHSGRHALVDLVEVIEQPIQSVAGRAGADADGVGCFVELAAEILQVLAGLHHGLASGDRDAADGDTHGESFHVQAADLFLRGLDRLPE